MEKKLKITKQTTKHIAVRQTDYKAPDTLAAAHPESRLIRINMDHPETPVELKGRFLRFDAEAAGVIAQPARQVSGA